ncbi:MAG: RNA polymerase sigma factor [Longimicrobiales bacterium]
MSQFVRRLRTPEERVGMLPNACLPPPAAVQNRTTSSAEDELLLRALRLGDEDAFARVLDLYFSGMLRLALTHVGSRATAEEVIQETWMAAIRGIDRFEGRSSVKTWLFRILRNLARTRGKQDARMRPFTDMERMGENGGSVDVADRVRQERVAGGHAPEAMWVRPTDPESQLLSGELRRELERAIAALPPRQREVIVLRDVEGWSADDVCNAMDISQTNQRVMLHRARDRVRNEIRWYLDDNDDCADDESIDVS